MSARSRGRPARRRAGIVAALLALVAGAAGCTPDPAPALARAAADAAAGALASGTAPADVFTTDAGDPPADLAAILRGLGDLRPRVEVGTVLTASGRGSAVLAWTWEVHAGKAPWTYTTPLRLAVTPAGWRAVWTPAVVHVELDPGERLRAVRLPAQRGEIIGSDGTRLVFRHAVERVGIDLTLVDRATASASARALANELGIAAGPLVARVEAASDRAFVEAQVLRVGDPAQRDALAAAKRIAGVRGITDERMLARTPTFARPLLGIVGEATAEAVERGGGEVRRGDVVGLSGLQAAQDAVLRGATGFRIEVVGAGDPVPLHEVAPRAGTPLTLTLDAGLQERADAAVAAVEPAASLVVLRRADGHVLAAASGPGGRGLSTATLGRYALGPPPAGLSAAASGLGWHTAHPGIGVPALLGEVAGGTVWASPLGVAAVVASGEEGRPVRPRLVLQTAATASEAPAPALSDAAAGAVADLADRVGAASGWSVRVGVDRVVVAHVDGGDAARLARAVG